MMLPRRKRSTITRTSCVPPRWNGKDPLSGCEVKGLLLDQQTGLVTMLAMFQVPNKFFEADGRVTDISGADWDSIWGHVFED